MINTYRVVLVHRNRYLVRNEGKELYCTLTGSLRYREAFPVVGDEVEITAGIRDFNGVVITIAYDMRVNGEQVFTGTSEHVFLDREGKFVRMKRVMPEFSEEVYRRIAASEGE